MTSENTITAPPDLDFDDLRLLLPDWQRHLRSMNRSPATIASYLTVGRKLVEYLVERGMPTTASGVKREHLEHFLGDLADRVSPATVAKHYRSMQQLFRWLTDDGEIPTSPMARMRPPQVPEVPVPVLSEEELAKLLATCKGNEFDHRRDTAILRLMIDTGMRLGEVSGLAVDDLDWDLDVAQVMGKGRRPRGCPFGNRTAEALRRYLRVRVRHSQAQGTQALWLGHQGGLTGSGVAQVLARRAAEAGIGHINPHRLRHTYAHRWLAQGGQETDLMRLAGWKSRQMVGRYASSAADSRAREAHRRLALGDAL